MTMRAEELARQRLLKYVATVAGAIASEMTTRELFSLVDDELRALAPSREALEAFERETATRWFEQQARTLKPKKVWDTPAKRRWALLAEIAAGKGTAAS